MAAKILFGTAGIPHSARDRSSVSGIERIAELGLDAMELEFVYGVNMKEPLARETDAMRKQKGIYLTVHAPYYINLTSKEKAKVGASRQRIFQSAKIGAIAGAKKIAFHAAFYQGEKPETVFEKVAVELEKILEKMCEEKVDAQLAPETTGKATQFGTVDELLAMTEAVKGVSLTVDFSHLHARCNGCMKAKKDFDAILEKIRGFNKKLLEDLHMHVSGINYSEKGERNHLMLLDKQNDFPFRLLLESLKDFGVQGSIACESPNLEEDALLLKKAFESL